MKKWFGSWLGVFIFALGANGQEFIANGRFLTGDFGGWTMFATQNGRLSLVSGLPGVTIEDLDHDGSLFDPDGNWSFVSRFQVQRTSSASIREGGGIYQSFATAGGMATINADIYAVMPFNFTKPDPGVFSLFVDGALIDEFDFELQRGDINPQQVFAASLGGELSLNAGNHELRILMRSSALNDGSAPLQYLDNISVTIVPEPSTLARLGGFEEGKSASASKARQAFARSSLQKRFGRELWD